jgi:hypothetical protein
MNESTEGTGPLDTPQGRYANYCRVGQNAMEFVIDFGQRYGETEPPQFHTRIVTTPLYMKAIVLALEEAVESYDKRFPTSLEEL